MVDALLPDCDPIEGAAQRRRSSRLRREGCGHRARDHQARAQQVPTAERLRRHARGPEPGRALRGRRRDEGASVTAALTREISSARAPRRSIRRRSRCWRSRTPACRVCGLQLEHLRELRRRKAAVRRRLQQEQHLPGRKLRQQLLLRHAYTDQTSAENSMTATPSPRRVCNANTSAKRS